MYYLILGDKKSGNVYDRQDRRIIEIIADELLIAIQNSIRFEEIQQFNVTLQQRVSDATVKLQRTNKKLRDLDETKDEFISMASHQLRTPLTSVKGYMSMVIEGDAGKLTKQQEMLLNQAFVSSQRMVYLIADLLNVSRLKTGKFVIDAQPADLSEIVQGELDQLTETAKGKKIELKYDKPKKLQKLMLDETKVRQVVMNFIDNAIYYTRSGGHIKVSVKEDESHVYFTVKDDGIGVPKEDQKHLFNKFYRAGNARNARPDGTGLGLFMAKKVVDAQGGSILFESAENKGSMFGFCFDKKKLAAESPDHR
jgi:signal transduction histidine kinase